MIISPCDGLPSLIDELNEGQSGVLLNGVLPLLSVEDTSKLLWLWEGVFDMDKPITVILHLNRTFSGNVIENLFLDKITRFECVFFANVVN